MRLVRTVVPEWWKYGMMVERSSVSHADGNTIRHREFAREATEFLILRRCELLPGIDIRTGKPYAGDANDVTRLC